MRCFPFLPTFTENSSYFQSALSGRPEPFASSTLRSLPVFCGIFFVLAFILGQHAHGQTTVGIQPLASYASGGLDQVNTANLGVHIAIPLFQHTGRGHGLGVKVSLVYDSAYWLGNPISDVGWRVVWATANPGDISVSKLSSEFVSQSCPPNNRNCHFGYTDTTYVLEFADSTGFTHPFHTAESIACRGNSPDGCTNVNLSGGGYAPDGSGYFMAINPGAPSTTPNIITVTAPSGEVYTWNVSSVGGAIGFTDANGNTGIASNPSSAVLTDDSGISATVTGGNYNVSGGGWTSRAPLQVQYLDTSGNPQTVTVTYSLTAGCSNVGMVDSITYPDGTYYHFTYQSAAGCQLSSVRLPAGGTISYNVGSLDQTGPGGPIGLPATLSRTTPDGTILYSQTANPIAPYSPYTATSTTTISKPDGSSEQIQFVYVQVYSTVTPTAGMTVYTYNYETAHTWSSASGALMKSTMKCYNGATGDCTTTPITLPITQIATTTTIDSLSTKTIENMNSAGLDTEMDEYGYGASSPTRKTITQYASLGAITARPSSVTVFDVTGQVSATTYGYDENVITPITGLQGHSTVSGSRGNLTSRHVWLNTTGGTIDNHWQYDDAGELLASQDPRTHNWTSYGYDSTTDLCRTSTTPPTAANGVSQTTSATCEPNTGLPATSTDVNQVQSSYSYDSMLRLTGISAKTSANVLVANTTRTYNVSSLPETITTTLHATPSPDEIRTTTLDGIGRPTRETAANGAVVDTTYNSMGYVQNVSNPYFTTSDSTYGITSFLYDGLGRKTYQCQPDNGSSASTTCVPTNSYQQWSYTNNVVTARDEAGNQSTNTYDAFGNLINVTEAGGQQTSYSYDALGNVLNVVQSGLTGETPRIRSFTYDSLSRQLCASNPENSQNQCPSSATSTPPTGVVRSTYDEDGNIHTLTDARGVITTYLYDSINRVISKSYSDGTPGEGIGYDGYSDANVSLSTLGLSSENPVGRISLITNNYNAATAYSYDPMGRIKLQNNVLPSTGAWGTITSATYDLAGNLTDLIYPDLRHIHQTFNSGGMLGQPGQMAIQDLASGQPYLQTVAYAADGSPQMLTLGDGAQQSIGKNTRLQTQSLSVLTAVNSTPYLSHSYCYVSCTTGGTANNGNIWGITDALNSSRTQGFTYDNLNRISSFTLGGVLNQQYSTDSFGNMSQIVGGQHVSAFDPATNRISNLPCATATNPYDAAGNQLCFSDQFGGVVQIGYDAENRITSMNVIGMTGSPFVSYAYGADGARVRKSSATGKFTEYVTFGDQTIAEKDQNSRWTDYIYTDGQKIAKVDSTDTRVHVTAVNQAGGWAIGQLPIPANTTTVQPGDVLSFRMYQHNATGTISLGFTDGSNSDWYCGSCYGPTGGISDQWVNVAIPVGGTVSSPGPMAYKTFSYFFIGERPGGPTGEYDILYADITLIHPDGSVVPFPVPLGNVIFGGNSPYSSGESGTNEVVSAAGGAVGAVADTHYYLDDHLGTTQMELSSGGWPLWQGQFTPFGQELDTQNTAMNYKFTGKERDTESGLDNFGARYFGSTAGRFMSPDPSGLAYANPADPQSLNLYAYVGNHPLQFVDPYGLSWFNTDCTGQHGQQAASVFTEVGNFFMHLFGCGTGGDGGGNGGAQLNGTGPNLSNAPQPLGREGINDRVDRMVRFLTMATNACDSVYSRVGKDLGIPYNKGDFAARAKLFTMDDPKTDPFNGADAGTDLDGTSGARNTSVIHLYKKFYSFGPDRQAGTVWHEETHAFFNLRDASPKTGPGTFAYVFKNYGYEPTDGPETSDFTDYILRGCKKKGK